MLWSRPAGPPHVWRVIELIDSSGKKRKFSLQEIPEERYEEAISHMCSIFIKDETMCAALDVINDPTSVDLGKKFWGLALSQGISVGAFEILPEGEEPILAGLNVLVYADNELDQALESIEWGKCRLGTVFSFVVEACKPVDPRKVYGVDGYLGAFGLSVDPKYRRMGLGQQLLEIRDDIGKEYDIKYTSTIFTSAAAQKVAAKAGFHTDLERPYEEGLKEDGSPLFPTLQGKTSKVMGKPIK